MTVIPLNRKPAYTPLDPPGRCMTPGHEERDARHYPGGWLCSECDRKAAALREEPR